MLSRGLQVGLVMSCLPKAWLIQNAVLGLSSQVSAQRLARLLLADPLGNEERWEKELEKAGDGSDNAVLLK